MGNPIVDISEMLEKATKTKPEKWQMWPDAWTTMDGSLHTYHVKNTYRANLDPKSGLLAEVERYISAEYVSHPYGWKPAGEKETYKSIVRDNSGVLATFEGWGAQEFFENIAGAKRKKYKKCKEKGCA